MTKKARKSLTNKVSILLLLFGLLLFISMFITYTAQESAQGSQVIAETLEFMSEQCIRYDSSVASETASDQIHLLDNARALDLCLSERDDPTDLDFLTRYAQDQRLSGIILTDKTLQPRAAVLLDDTSLTDWTAILQDDNLRDIIDYPAKCALSSVEYGQKQYDYVAVQLSDGSGILFCYDFHDSASSLSQNRMASLLSGYQLDMDGTIFITDGETILSSNKETLQGKSVSDSSLVSHHSEELSSGSVVTFRENGAEYMAGFSKCKNYRLYAFFPTKEIYRQRAMAVAYMLALYILLILVVAIIRQQEAKHSNMSKRDFLHRMSHDIRTPINGIRGMVQIGDNFPDDPAKQVEVRRKIWEASDLLIDLVNDVLDMSKLESGEMKLESKPFNLRDLVKNIVTVLEDQAKGQKITLQLAQLEGTHWDLIGSPVQVRRVLVNIIVNAIKYNRENGSVTVSIRELKRKSDSGKVTYEFVCSDTGIGMSAEFQTKMFAQFSQEDVVGEVAHHGTGLGLPIVKALVQEMNGTIRCTSERNVGTTFTITLPFAVNTEVATAPVKTEAVQEPLPGKSLEGVSILMVEDNELNMEIAEFLLEDEGATITEAWNGQEALDLFQQSKPGEFQVILMDLMMPVMDGETATKAIRALDRPDAKTIPIIALTANAFNEDIQMAYNIGMNAYLTKPINSEQLKLEIRRFCPAT